MRYMIHAYPGRMWYVEGYLVPKLKELGIKAKDIVVWNDRDGKGNLRACMEAFAWCGAHPTKDGTWHLQDDVIPCKDFKERIKGLTKASEVTCAYGNKHVGQERRRRKKGRWKAGGIVKPEDMWWSFQCIHIPDGVAKECAVWFREEAMKNSACVEFMRRGEGDDWFFKVFLMEKHPDMGIMQVTPNLVDHVSDLIGGSVLNHTNGFRSATFVDTGEWAELEEWIRKTRGKAE